METENYALEQAKAQLSSIVEMVRKLEQAREDDTSLDDARQTIQEDPLSVEVRSNWYTPGARDADTKPAQFRILLCTGGPAVQIVGALSQYGEPEKPTIQYQDWGTPWTDYVLTKEEAETVTTYCREFYFGEG